MKPLVSFVVPAYNRAHYLPDTIESLLRQTLKEIEVIVVDDGSTDTTPEIMKWFEEKDKRVRYFRREHLGASSARNFGNSQARADIIATADSDDFNHLDRAKVTYKFFDRYHDVDMMYGTYVKCDFWGMPVWKHPIKLANFEHTDRFVHPLSAFRKRVLMDNPYNENIPHDIDGDLLRRLFKKNYQCAITPVILGKIRFSYEGLSAKQYGVKKKGK